MADLGELVTTLPCGCSRGIVKRLAPDIDESGHPKLENGAFVMKEVEELEDSHCPEHSKILIERQHEVQRALESGASPEDALRILAGATPLPLLTDGRDE